MLTWINLSERTNDMLTITLDFCKESRNDPTLDAVRVHVMNHRNNQDFTLYPNPSDALDCFNHPFAYSTAFLNGKSKVAA
jgi:hypothetical protein